MSTEGKVSPLPLGVRSHGPATRMCDLTFAEGLAGHIQIWRNGVLGTQEEIDAFAAFIVRAVNAHDRLVAALEAVKKDRAYQRLSGGAHFTSAQTETEWKHESAQKAWALVDAALAAAKEGK